MKRLFSFAMLLMAFIGSNMAQKTVYIPYEWRTARTDTLLYSESDPENKYTWSKTRSIESDNVIIFWDKYYGSTAPNKLSSSNFYYVDINDLLKKCEAFYDLEINKLGFVDPQTSNLAKYKVMVLMNHTQTWTCYGGGYDFMVSALWLNPSTCKPVGHSVAHEVGHSFHYMCFAEHSGHKDSSTDGTGFHLAVGNGQTIWEQTAQWQANQSYPDLMFSQSYSMFRYTHNYAFTHEWHRYQSYWFLYYLCQHYNDIRTVADVWNQPMTGAIDFNQALMALKGLTASELYALYFDYAMHCVTWDFEVCKPYREAFIGDFTYRCVLTEDDEYQVALASCPQSTGFNVIPLQVPEAGTEVITHFTGVNAGASLLDADPGEYFDGDSRYTPFETRKYVAAGTRSYRGFRVGYVALMEDGTRQYFYQDTVYNQGIRNTTDDIAFTAPKGISKLWLVVSPSLKAYQQHKWDEKIDGDDMWPYKFTIEGSDLAYPAIIYASPTIDDREIADITFTYDVHIPYTGTSYTGCMVELTGKPAAALGTAFQLQPSSISSKMQTWSSSGPANGRIMFYPSKTDGTLVQSGSTANGYGHWFNTSGTPVAYENGYLYSEFTPSTPSFYIGQYPGRLKEGQTYTICQALRYRKSPKAYATANFIFNVTVGGNTSSASLKSIDYDDPTVGIKAIESEMANGTSPKSKGIYDLSGRKSNIMSKGIYIKDGRKVVIK